MAAFTITVPARLDAFAQLRTFVEDVCASAGVPRTDGLRVLLLVEELFVNTVLHGYGQDCDEPVTLGINVAPEAIVVAYEDVCRAYDPFATAAPARDADDVDARPVGGLGILLITTMAEDVGYARRDDRNCISFRLAR